MIKYYIPAGATEKIDTIVYGSAFYKNKPVWIQKFYCLADYIAAQNINNEHDIDKDYVNIHQETMAAILGVDNRQVAAMLKDAVSSGLLIKDGIFKAAVIAGSGKNKIYIADGKSYGYQFKEHYELTEIRIADNRSMNEHLINNTWDKFGKYFRGLPEYRNTLSFIKIDAANIEDMLHEVLSNKQKKKSQKEKYSDFISETELHSVENNKKIITTIPFDGVIVPAKNHTLSTAACSYLSCFEGGVFVPCELCTIEIVRYRDKSALTSIAQCKRALYLINSGYMIPTRTHECSRVFCAVTNLNRALRKAIRLDGKKIIGLDIANCQPLLASVLIKKYWRDKEANLPNDVAQYIHDCEAGQFYNNFMIEINLPDELRAQFKEDFFSKVFFSKVIEKNNVLKDMFIKKYPSCWVAICDIKGGMYSDDYNYFARMLQAVEASIIFDDVNLGLISKGIKAFNIFDSIYVNNRQDFETAKQMTKEAFNRYGLNPTLKIEYEEHLTYDEEQNVREQHHGRVSGTQIIDQIIDQIEKAIEHKPEAELTADEQRHIDEWEERLRKNEERNKEQEMIRKSYLDRSVKDRRWGY